MKCDSAVENHQFGFKAGHSTSLCTSVLKQTVDYYTNRGSYVFACFIDFQKAFDKVNYWKLFLKLLDDGVNNPIVQIVGCLVQQTGMLCKMAECSVIRLSQQWH